MSDDATLEAELEALLQREWFDPPEDFVAGALVKDLSVHEAAERDPVGWWEEQARALDWFEPWEHALEDEDAPFYRWFSGGKLNVSHNCLDRHVAAGLGDRVALHWHGEEGESRAITYAELLADVQRCANALKARGIGPGDVVGIYLPMIPEVVVAMLACTRIGAPHNVVFGGFSAESVHERMAFSNASALITADGGRRKGKTAPVKAEVDRVMRDLSHLETIMVVRHTGEACEMREGRDVWWHEALQAADPECPAEPLDAEHPLFILYSSGSTAKPKGIQHTTGGYLTGVTWSFRHVFDVKPETDVFWCSADVGWITGHSYI
ncbi:MAG TPA: AMP-binding protein, partial [Solirubrobacteraceae bacterium]|nr:AMP-binding protein [Solirubrobacteraceae bacterium]